MKYIREFLAYVLVLALLCLDFFSDWHIWSVIPKKVLIIIFIIGLFVCFVPLKKLDTMANFWMQLRVIVFLIVMIMVLPLFGGKSDIGLSLSQPFFLMIIALTIFQLRMQWKRAKHEKEQEEELKKQQEKQQGKRKK
ncbi:hypothetical protein [Kurthia sibirica]|uniref:hypothetical protein n=1 Tax=Kurthia sibirica TaxID=202750 RepID=UPI001173695F|nr:hypothetical protein [Kurthia sibirica]GEK34579.1 hypothetical protein KSI01_21120 [Kurthia sibirica]